MRWCRHQGPVSPSPSNQSWLRWREAATLAWSYQYSWTALLQEGSQWVAVPPKAAAAAEAVAAEKTLPNLDAMGGTEQVRERYEAHLPSLSLWYGENSWFILAGAVLPTLHN